MAASAALQFNGPKDPCDFSEKSGIKIPGSSRFSLGQAKGSKELIISELLRDKIHLKDEVCRLREELRDAQALIEALRRKNIDLVDQLQCPEPQAPDPADPVFDME